MSKILLVAILLLTAACQSRPHVSACDARTGVEQARCLRHEKMFVQCGPLKDEAHFACDREFLLANPLQCGAFSGKAAESCRAENAAFKSCEPKPGRGFMQCVRMTTGESPMGH